MFDQGRVPRLDLARAETEATLAQSEADRADAARAGAASALAALLGLPPIPEAATGGAMPSPGDGPPMQEWIDRAVTTAPDVAAQQSRVHAAQARLTLAERQQLPGITLEAGAEYADPTQPGTDARAAIALTLPLDSGAKTNLAGAELARENGELARVRRLAAARTEAAWRTAAASRRALEAIDATAIPSAREAADLTRLAYREGKVDLFRLLDAEKALSNAESEKWQAFGAWGAAWADLLWFSGETPP
jgi:outer membrane protein TolC